MDMVINAFKTWYGLVALVLVGPTSVLLGWQRLAVFNLRFKERKLKPLRELLKGYKWKNEPTMLLQLGVSQALGGGSVSRREFDYLQTTEDPLLNTKCRLTAADFVRFEYASRRSRKPTIVDGRNRWAFRFLSMRKLSWCSSAIGAATLLPLLLFAAFAWQSNPVAGGVALLEAVTFQWLCACVSIKAAAADRLLSMNSTDAR